MKPTRTYVMTKSTKRMLAKYLDPHRYGSIKTAMIQAELASLVQVRTRTKDKEPSND